MSNPIATPEELRAAEEAAERARSRLGADRECRAPTVIADPAVAEIRRIGARLELVAPDWKPEAAVDADGSPQRRRALALATIPPGRHWARFDAPELEARVPSKLAIAASRRAVRAPYVVWRGGSGLGKTSLACAALRARIEGGWANRPLFVPSWRLAVARSRHALGAGEPEIVERAFKADILVLDELADQHCATSAVSDVIFEREANGLPTWVTTWLSPAEVAKILGDGIARRVFERSVPIDCAEGVRQRTPHPSTQ